MKKLYVCLFGILAWSGSAMATPCVSGTIASYAALGATGCTVGASNQFTIANVAFVMVALAVGSDGPTSPSDIGFNATVVGGTPEVDITAINGTKFETKYGLLGAAGLYNAEVAFSVDSTVPTTGFITTSLDIAGITTGLVALNQVAEVNCLGGVLPRPLGTGGLACLGGGITATTAAQTPLLGVDATASLVYSAVTHVDVIKEITQTTVLGLLGADARIDSIKQQFLTGTIGGGGGSPTPEPTTLLLLGSSFITLGWIRRKQKG